MSLHVIILAAGAGKRMFSKLPKVLHPLAGKSLISWVIETAEALKPDGLHVIYGHQGETLKNAVDHPSIHWVCQKEQLGTGHAVLQALPFIPDDALVLILSADVPLIQLATLEALLKQLQSNKETALSLLLATLSNPFGLGRIVRDANGSIQAIVEEKDASPSERMIQEIYSGICCVRASSLAQWLPHLSCNNAQGEYYLTDIIALAVREEQSITSLEVKDTFEIQGVNHRGQLQELERIWQKRQATTLMLQGISIADAERIDIRGELHCGQDVFIDVNCVFIGQVHIGDDCIIEPNCILNNVSLGAGCHIHANSVLEGSVLGKQCHVGPYARMRPGTVLADQCKIGNFVETKKAVLGDDSKASHLSYLGDVTIGKGVNIGAGTITCNYDGVNKHQTIIEDGVFVGSDTQFIAPVTIGAHATIGAGSTIRKDVPAGELTLTAHEQKTIYGWKRPRKK